jgi:hypothetical protein
VDEPAAEARAKRRLPAKRWIALPLVVVLSVPAWSYAQVLTASSTDSIGARSVEWLRDHGANGLVNRVEHWWYSHHQPRKGGAPAAVLLRPPTGRATPRSSVGPHLPAPANVIPLASPALPAEGVWRPAGRTVSGVPAVYETALRPDSVHGGLATGVAWIDTSLVRAELFAGTQLPGGTWVHEAPIPVARRSLLLAAFNSGFKLNGSRGGYFAEGKTVRPLVDGAASLVIDSSGKPTVGQWGRDVGMGATVASVRQNLSLIVDGGAPAPGLDENLHGRWGFTLGNRVLVWRSGVGVTSNGALVYAAGNGLSVATLARVLIAAGAQRAMELDINSEWTRFFTYEAADPLQPTAVVGTKLVPDMRSSPNLYLESETRDFIAVMAR